MKADYKQIIFIILAVFFFVNFSTANSISGNVNVVGSDNKEVNAQFKAELSGTSPTGSLRPHPALRHGPAC